MVLHAQVLHMPVKLSLELMTSVGANSFDAKWKPLNNIINKLYSICPILLWIDLQSPYAGSITMVAVY
jgi:hypothetical protein